MGFKADDYQEDQMDFSPIPAGDYDAMLVKVERKESSTAGNYYQNCQFKIVNDKKYKGRIIFHMFHLENSDACVKIAKGQLSSFMKSALIKELKDVWDFTPLMNAPCYVKIGIQKDPAGTYDPKNVIKAFIFDKPRSTEEAVNNDGSEPWGEEPWGDKKEEKKKEGKDKKKKKKKKKE